MNSFFNYLFEVNRKFTLQRITIGVLYILLILRSTTYYVLLFIILHKQKYTCFSFCTIKMFFCDWWRKINSFETRCIRFFCCVFKECFYIVHGIAKMSLQFWPSIKPKWNKLAKFGFVTHKVLFVLKRLIVTGKKRHSVRPGS